MRKGIDILNLEWASAGRDREVATLICSSLRGMGYAVVEGSIFEARRLMARHRPRLLYVADPRGARVNNNVASMARELGVPTVSFVAEGNLPDHPSPTMIWGHTPKGRPAVDLLLMWTVRARSIVARHAPETARTSRVVGAVGFDRYRILDLATRDNLIDRLRPGESFERVVGYAGWAFDRLEDPSPDAAKWRQRFASDLKSIAHIGNAIAELITAAATRHPHVLFLLKVHPGTREGRTEISQVPDLTNVCKIRDEVPIHDCVAGCDLWTAFESTTWLEAWLAGTPTVTIEPAEPPQTFRSRLADGSPRVRTADQLADSIPSTHESSPGYEELAALRTELIEEVVQWDDGRNHLRAAHEIASFLNRLPDEPPRMPGRLYVAGLLETGRIRAAQRVPALQSVAPMAKLAERFSAKELKQLVEQRQSAVHAFDRRHPLGRAELDELARVNDGYGPATG